MKSTLAILSVFCFLAFGGCVLMTTQLLTEDFEAENDTECVTPLPPPDGPTTQRCDGTDATGGQVTFAVYGGSSLLAGAVLAAASVSVRPRQRHAGPPPWTPPPPPAP